MIARRVSANTLDLIAIMCAGCCERATALRSQFKKLGLPADDAKVIYEVNAMTLNYFIGATACAASLGISELEAHLKHFLLTEVQPLGYVAVERMGSKAKVH